MQEGKEESEGFREADGGYQKDQQKGRQVCIPQSLCKPSMLSFIGGACKPRSYISVFACLKGMLAAEL